MWNANHFRFGKFCKIRKFETKTWKHRFSCAKWKWHQEQQQQQQHHNVWLDGMEKQWKYAKPQTCGLFSPSLWIVKCFFKRYFASFWHSMFIVQCSCATHIGICILLMHKWVSVEQTNKRMNNTASGYCVLRYVQNKRRFWIKIYTNYSLHRLVTV